MSIETFQPEIASLRNHPELNEQWLQEQIARNPAILGLGDLVLRDRERRQPTGGRLDLLLQDPDTLRRYEVEIQLGQTDETHIIRTIEYWDIERRRYPQYEHCAVIVAEDITTRFLNVISLFNGFIPLIALKLQAVRVDNRIGLLFTRVLDELTLGLDEEDDAQPAVDRAYWEQRGTPETLRLADRLLEMMRTFAPEYEFKYNKYYIGPAQNGVANNYLVVRPQKSGIRLEVRIPESDETSSRLEVAGLDVLDYNRRWNAYKIKLTKADIDKHRDLLIELMREAHKARNR